MVRQCSQTSRLANDPIHPNMYKVQVVVYVRSISEANENSLAALTRLGGYDVGRPKLACRYDFSEKPATHVDDTSFAGHQISRRSTSSGCVVTTGYMVKHWSKTQSTIVLSSRKAEQSGIGSSMAQARSIQHVAADMGWNSSPACTQTRPPLSVYRSGKI